MATTVVVGGIKPDLPILGDTQQFIFNKPVAQTQCVNTTAATSAVSPQINLDFLNASTRGFRLNQSTTTTVPGGIFSLNSVQYQVSSYASTPLFTFNEGGLDSFAFKKTVKFEQACQSIAPTSGADVANKTYVDGKTLNSFAVPTGDVSLNNKKITQLAPPTASTDATTKEYVDGKTWSRSQISDLNTASLSMFASPASDLDLNNRKITNLATPTAETEAVTKKYTDTTGGGSKRGYRSYYPSSTDLTTTFIRGISTKENSNKNTGIHSSSYIIENNTLDFPNRTPLELFQSQKYTYGKKDCGIISYGNTTEDSTDINYYGKIHSALVLGEQYTQIMTRTDNLGLIVSDIGNSTQSYMAYLSSGGYWSSSSQAFKHSLRAKKPKGYLERLNKLNVYSYGRVYKNSDEENLGFRNRHMEVGMIAEEVAEVLDNCTDRLKLLDADILHSEEFKDKVGQISASQDKTDEDYIQAKNAQRSGDSLNYNVLLCYTILALQELTQKVDYLDKKPVKRRRGD